MSDIALKPATTLTNYVINVDQPWHVTLKQLELKSGRLCCFGAFNKWSINVDNSRQSTSWSRWSSLSRANCHSVWLIAPYWSVASPAWVHRLAVRRPHRTFDVKTAICDSLTIYETINRFFPVVNFFTICYKYRIAFNCCFQDADISLGSVATHLKRGGIFNDSVTTNFLLILTVTEF